MRWHLFFSLLFLFPSSLWAAFEFVDVGARPVGLGGAFCAVSDDVHGLLHNPAGMGWAAQRSVSLSLSRPFGLAQLDVHEFSALQPLGRWAVGLRARRFGDHLYREMTVGLGGAHRLLNNLSLGLCLRGLQVAISGYGSDEAWSLDVGLLGLLTSRCRWGMCVHNLNNGHLGKTGEEMPQVLMVGFACCPEKNVLLCADLVEDVADISNNTGALGKYPIELHLGCEGRPCSPLTLRLGLQNSPIRFSGGLELRGGPLSLGYACCSHRLLGLTHHFTMTWR